MMVHIIPDHFAYQLEGSLFNDTQSDAWKAAKSDHALCGPRGKITPPVTHLPPEERTKWETFDAAFMACSRKRLYANSL
jgi:hypothetical protein